MILASWAALDVMQHLLHFPLLNYPGSSSRQRGPPIRRHFWLDWQPLESQDRLGEGVKLFPPPTFFKLGEALSYVGWEESLCDEAFSQRVWRRLTGLSRPPMAFWRPRQLYLTVRQLFTLCTSATR